MKSFLLPTYLFLLFVLPTVAFAQTEHAVIFSSRLMFGGGIIGSTVRVENAGGSNVNSRYTTGGFGIDWQFGANYLIKERFASGIRFNFGGILGTGYRNEATNYNNTIVSILFGTDFLFPIKNKLSGHVGAYIGPGFIGGAYSNRTAFTMELSGGLSYEVIPNLRIDGGLKYQFFVAGSNYESNFAKSSYTLDYHLIGVYGGARYILRFNKNGVVQGTGAGTADKIKIGPLKVKENKAKLKTGSGTIKVK
jgi:hypothetical protein